MAITEVSISIHVEPTTRDGNYNTVLFGYEGDSVQAIVKGNLSDGVFYMGRADTLIRGTYASHRSLVGALELGEFDTIVTDFPNRSSLDAVRMYERLMKDERVVVTPLPDGRYQIVLR